MTEKSKENACHGEKCINGYARLKNTGMRPKPPNQHFH